METGKNNWQSMIDYIFRLCRYPINHPLPAARTDAKHNDVKYSVFIDARNSLKSRNLLISIGPLLDASAGAFQQLRRTFQTSIA